MALEAGLQEEAPFRVPTADQDVLEEFSCLKVGCCTVGCCTVGCCTVGCCTVDCCTVGCCTVDCCMHRLGLRNGSVWVGDGATGVPDPRNLSGIGRNPFLSITDPFLNPRGHGV
jgi:hypothetical protein